MPVTLVLGGQWGDEGKAKIVDSLSPKADFIVRFQGGANAGHTVIVKNERYAFHLIPSGILYPHVKCVLGGGMVIDPNSLVREIDGIRKRGVNVDDRIFVSSQAHMVFPHHMVMDRGQEALRGERRIGSTGRGITPAYVDKVGREGIRMCVFLKRKKAFEEFMEERIRLKNKILRSMGFKTIPLRDALEDLLRARAVIRPMIMDTRRLLWEAVENKKYILCEGAQGALLDLDHGTYPYVTSSSVTSGGAATGSGIPPTEIKRIIGVFKAYCTRVGNGPFPTEERGSIGDKLRDVGLEYGTTTGRPRRCGWFDAVSARTVIKLNGITEIALTKLDVLDGFSKIKVCTEYRLGRKSLEFFPVDTELLSRCRPKYIEFEGWGEESMAGRFGDLPARARRYVKDLERMLGCRISFISLGPRRGELIRVS